MTRNIEFLEEAAKDMNLLKIKFRDLGIRVVYKIIFDDGIMKIVVVSARADEQVYKEAAKRREKYQL